MQSFVEELLGIDVGPGAGIELWGNTVYDYGFSFVLFLLLAAVFALVQYVIIARLRVLSQKTATDVDDTLINIVSSIRPSFYFFVAAYLALRALAIPAMAWSVLNALLLVWIAVQVVFALQQLIDYVVRRYARRSSDEAAEGSLSYLANIVKWLLWVIAVLLILSNFGINVTSVLAGLGIAGVAVGFALQNILADLFSSFAIHMDKPFRPGDFIVIGADSGTVEKIGIKTTRLRALSGEELVVSNRELTSTRVQNFRKLQERRVVFSFGVVYETPVDVVRSIPELVGDEITACAQARLDHVHFKSFGDSGLIFEAIYYVLSDQYNDYLDVQQDINVRIMEVFEREGIAFAYPTQTVHLHK